MNVVEAKSNLAPVLAPRSVAIIGASEKGHYASALHGNLLKGGFPVESLYPVNPGQKYIFGLPCYPSVKDIPGSVELAVVVVPQPLVLQVARESVEKGVQAMLVVSTGFAEVGEEGRKRQEELSAVARGSGMRLVGPNTLGYIRPASGALLWASSLPQKLAQGRCAAIFQSSGMLNLLFNVAAQRGVGFSLGLAPGNEADLSLTDCLSWAIEDSGTSVIALVIESIRAPERFRHELERALELEKPIIALRLGRSARARRSIVSHTGSLATSGEAWDALFEQTGVIRVDNLDEIVEAVVFFDTSDRARLKGNRVGLITISGGDCSLLSDICDRAGLSLPDLDGKSREVVARELKKDSFLGNPLDVEDLLASSADGFYRSLESFAAFEAFDVIGARLNLPEKPKGAVAEAYRRIAEIARGAGKQAIFFSRASEQLVPEWFELFSSLKVPFLLEYEKGLRTLRKALRWAEKWRARERGGKEASPASDLVSLKGILEKNPGRALGLEESLLLFREYAIPFVRTELAHSPSEARDFARAIGFPVVLKLASPDVAHRSDIGAVRIGLKTADEVEEAYHYVIGRARGFLPNGRIEGVIVQPLVEGVGEVILGISQDEQLGPVILLGMGGIYVEVLKDVVLRLPPLGLEECQEMIQGLRGKAVFEGARGRPPGDLDALAKAIHALSRMALDLREEIGELDLNPVIVRPKGEGIVAVDGLVVSRSPGAK